MERQRLSVSVYVRAFAADGHHYKEDKDAGKDRPQEVILKVWRVKKGRQEIRRHDGRKKSGSRRTSGATKTLKKTAVKVMAGAAAGAVRAIIPPLEEAAGTSERAAGIKQGSGSKSGKSSKGRKSGK